MSKEQWGHGYYTGFSEGVKSASEKKTNYGYDLLQMATDQEVLYLAWEIIRQNITYEFITGIDEKQRSWYFRSLFLECEKRYRHFIKNPNSLEIYRRGCDINDRFYSTSKRQS